jgi:hypothetical protein
LLYSYPIQQLTNLTRDLLVELQPQYLFQILEFHISQVLPTTQEPHQWTQMLQCGKELKSMTVRSMEKNNTKRMQMIFKLMDKLKRMLPTLESHMLQHLFNLIPQPNMLRMMQVFHILMVVELTTQEPHQWIQMVQFGKELKSMMVRFTEKSNTKRMPTTSRPMVKLKRMLLTLESHMHPLLFNLKPQEQSMFQILESHIFLVLPTTQVLPPWTQMPLFGKEVLSMTVKSMEKSNIKRTPMISKPTENSKKLLLTLESHTPQPWSKPKTQSKLERLSNHLVKYQLTSNSLALVMITTLMMISQRTMSQRPLKLPLMSHMISNSSTSPQVRVS